MLKPEKFLDTEKHVKRTLILKVTYACCAHITDFGLIAYQRILALFIHKTKAYIANKLSLDIKRFVIQR